MTTEEQIERLDAKIMALQARVLRLEHEDEGIDRSRLRRVEKEVAEMQQAERWHKNARASCECGKYEYYSCYVEAAYVNTWSCNGGRNIVSEVVCLECHTHCKPDGSTVKLIEQEEE